MSQKKRFILISVAIVAGLCVAWFAWRFFSKEGAVQTPGQNVATYVRVVEVKDTGEHRIFSFPGVSESKLANLSFRIAGPVDKVEPEVGEFVSQGEVIARVDRRDYELLVQRIETEIVAAEAVLTAMTTGARAEDIATLESALTAATSQAEQAETNLNRFTKLLAEQAVTQAQFDAAKTLHDVAVSQKEAAEQQLKKGETGSRKEEIEAAEAKIKGLNVSLAEAKNKLDDTVLLAPYDGYVVEKFVEDHEIVSPGMAVVSFADARWIDVSASLPEEMVVRRAEIVEYSCEFEAWPGKAFPARLKEMGHAIQRGKQTYPLVVRIEVPPDAVKPLIPGMTATVKLKTRRPNRPLVVPTAALLSQPSDGKTTVWIVESQTGEVVGRTVRVLRFLDDGAEIEGDLRPGDRIVAAGARLLSERQKVEIIAEKP